MKAVQYGAYGGADVLHMVNVPEPVAGKGEVLVQVAAVSVNPLDWKLRQGEMRIITGKRFPRGIAADFAGRVVAVGPGASQFTVGEDVFGAVPPFVGGALAEYVVVKESALCRKPQQISFPQAAALPVAGCAALHIFTKLARAETGVEVLVNGATGGVGMFATQIAVRRGARVTAVTGSAGVPLAQGWGCAAVLDYTRQSVLEGKTRYHIIIDASDKLPFAAARSIMHRHAAHVGMVPGFSGLVGSAWNNLFSAQKSRFVLSSPTAAALKKLAEYCTGGMDVVVGKTFPFADFARAYEEIPRRGFVGKAVILVNESLCHVEP